MDERGLVVARHRRHVTVEDAEDQRYQCVIGKRKIRPLVGDRVVWARQGDRTGIVTSVLPRTTTLTRIDSRGRREAVAANLSQLLIVVAATPNPDWFLLDRYLLAAELMKTQAVIVFNKSDLVEEPPEFLEAYAKIGYAVHVTSAARHLGLEELADAMQKQRSAIVGQSGVGKSSLINALLGEEQQRVGELSAKAELGRHTTTAATLYRLANGGELIDSPGVRQYTPYIEGPADLAQGYKEFHEYLGACRFDDCRHLAEPDCAIKTAVDGGHIDARRYDSYVKLRELYQSLRSP